LFDTSLVSTSATITQVAEAFALPENAVRFTLAADLLPQLISTSVISTSTIGTASNLAAAIPATLTARSTVGSAGHATGGVDPQQLVPQQVGDPSALASLTGMSLLQQLAILQEGAIAEFVSGNPESVQTLIDSPPAAREVQLWWGALGIDARSDLMSSAPQLVGNLEGIPLSLRYTANRSYLTSTIGELSAAQAAGRSEALDASTQLSMLKKVDAALVAPAGAPARSLLSLDASGAGTAAIVIGDLSTADYVSILVPGMFYTVDGQMDAWTAAAQGLYDEQVAWIDELGLGDKTVATVAWIGYETPSLVNFTSLDLAYGGSKALATTVNGLHALRGADQPYLAVVAHSYGSTVAMMALTDYGIDIDSIGLIGSPGSAAQVASDLGVPGDNVYVGEADWDQIKDSAFFGSDPGSSSFGAHKFRVSGEVDPLTGVALSGSTGHDEYLMVGSESLRNLALIALGQGRLITADSDGGLSKGATAYHHQPR
jgi:hypothetical protein